MAGGTQDPWHRTQDTKDTFTPDLADIDGQERKRLDLLPVRSNVCFALLLHTNFLLFIYDWVCTVQQEEGTGYLGNRRERGNRKGQPADITIPSTNLFPP